MNIDKLMHKFGKRLEENYTWYQVKHIQGVLADVLTAQEDEIEGFVKVPYCNKCGGEHLTEEHTAQEGEDK